MPPRATPQSYPLCNPEKADAPDLDLLLFLLSLSFVASLVYQTLSPRKVGKGGKGLLAGKTTAAAAAATTNKKKDNKKRPISRSCRVGLQELFEYVALQLAMFVSTDTEGSKDAQATTNNLGVSISYPVDQATASAIKWKSFSAGDMVDDTTADLAGGRYYNNESIAAITLGMTTNAAYIEPPQEVPKWHGPSPKSREMVIITEWENFKSQQSQQKDTGQGYNL